jgi:PAS domain S-box-containing protein
MVKALDNDKEKLTTEVVELRGKVAVYKEQNARLIQTEAKLTNRLKELNFLNKLFETIDNHSLSEEECFQQIADLIPLAWQYPKISCARITVNDLDYKTKNFKITKWLQSAKIFINDQSIGQVEIYYSIQMPKEDEEQFLKEERKLIDLLAETLGNYLGSKRFEKVLRKREELYRTIFDSSPMALFIIDLDGIVLNWNQAAQVIFGWDKDEVIGKSLPIVPPEKQNEFKQLREILKQGKSFTGKELIRQKKDGSQIIISLSTAPLFDIQGKITSIMCVIEDITEKVQAQEQLKSSYQLLQMAGETAKFGGWSVDLEKDLCTWSDQVADIHETPHGFSPPVEEGIQFYAPEWREKITQVFTDCAQKGIPYDEEMQIITSQGERVWVRTVGEAVRDKDGKIVRVQGSFQDISVQKEAQEALRVEREQLLALFDSIEQAIYVSDPKSYEIIFVNKYMRNLFDEDPIGGICYQVFQGLDKPCEFCTNEIIFQEIEKPYTWEYYNPLLDRDFLITDKAICWIDDRDVRFEIAIDITKQKQAEKELRVLKDSLEQQVAEKTQELQERVRELERFHDATVVREIRMKELRDEIKRLKEENNDR